MFEVLNKLSVLYVDDDRDTLNFLETFLSKFFSKVFTTTSGIEGYNYFLEYKPDLIITDLVMSNLDGVSLVSKIRDINDTIPIVVISAQKDCDNLIKLINHGLSSYILKPVRLDNLLANLSKIFLPSNSCDIKISQNISLNSLENMIYYDDKSVKISTKEKNFLILISNKNNQFITYEQMEYYIWQDKIMTTNAMKTFIKELRQKLPKDSLINIPKTGFKLKNTSKK
jgi:two-component system, OmpR family, response regulator VanR